MGSLTYAAMLVFVVLAVTPLELVLEAGVARRARRLALTVVCAGVPFVVWDLLAVHAGHWTFGPDRILGWVLPGGLPIEEVAFFVVVPVASVLSLEAVRRFWGWRVGDEPEREARR